ncbi:MAG TPA: hypothetical protein VFI70_10435 [Nitrososphaeraceae archaeon]|nr:hypothetical protein [Nitrososphaeraceae archaeon]
MTTDEIPPQGSSKTKRKIQGNEIGAKDSTAMPTGETKEKEQQEEYYEEEMVEQQTSCHFVRHTIYK